LLLSSEWFLRSWLAVSSLFSSGLELSSEVASKFCRRWAMAALISVVGAAGGLVHVTAPIAGATAGGGGGASPLLLTLSALSSAFSSGVTWT
jgi:hypothetical protein